MPANLTPQYQAAEDAFKAAETHEEKLAALEEMLKSIPKHKGTEKMQAELKKRISKMKTETAHEEGKKTGKVDPYRVVREGAAQAFVVGPVNSGKSSIVGWLTNAKVTVAEYPFSTVVPISGMMLFEDIKLELVDTPAIIPDDPVPALFSNARLADVLIVVLDSSSEDQLGDLSAIVDLLTDRKVLVESRDASHAGITPDRMLIACNKADIQGDEENIGILKELYPAFTFLRCSALTGEGLSELPRIVFEKAGIIRVYAKPPGGKLERKDPYVVKKGSCVEDVAEAIHKELKGRFKSARLWGSSKFSGMSVHRDFIVSDGDIIEFD